MGLIERILNHPASTGSGRSIAPLSMLRHSDKQMLRRPLQYRINEINRVVLPVLGYLLLSVLLPTLIALGVVTITPIPRRLLPLEKEPRDALNRLICTPKAVSVC